MGLLKFHERTREMVSHRKLYTSEDPTEECTAAVEDAMTRLYRVGKDLTAGQLYCSLVRPWKKFFEDRSECKTPLLVIVVFDKEAHKPAMKRAVQLQRSASSPVDPYPQGTYFDSGTQSIRDPDTCSPVLVEGPRIMRTPSLKRQLASWLWQNIQHDIEQWPANTCIVLDFDDEPHVLNKAGYTGLESLLSKVEPIGEAEINATRWIQRLQALPPPHQYRQVQVTTRDSDVALLTALHFPASSQVKVFWLYDTERWMRVFVLRDCIRAMFGDRLDQFFVLNVLSGCDFFERGDVLHYVKAEAVIRTLAFSTDLQPLVSFPDFDRLVRRIYGVALKLVTVRSDLVPHHTVEPSWSQIAHLIAKSKVYRLPQHLEQSFSDLREIAVYWFTLQQQRWDTTTPYRSVVELMTTPWEPPTRLPSPTPSPSPQAILALPSRAPAPSQAPTELVEETAGPLAVPEVLQDPSRPATRDSEDETEPRTVDPSSEDPVAIEPEVETTKRRVHFAESPLLNAFYETRKAQKRRRLPPLTIPSSPQLEVEIQGAEVPPEARPAWDPGHVVAPMSE